MATDKLKIGSSIPNFSNLPTTAGKKYSLKDFDKKNILVLMFSCDY